MTLPKNIGRFQKAAKTIVAPLFRMFWKTNVSGLEHVPRSGPAILAPNHVSVLDSFVVPAVIGRRLTYVGKAEYLDDWKTRSLFPALGMIPIDRSGGDAAKAALDAAAGLLGRGELFGIYPEGTRSRSGLLHKGRTGAARLAIRTGAPIVPVGIKGTREIQPPDAPFPRPFKACDIVFGPPIDTALYGDADDPLMPRRVTDDLMFTIAELSGQEYVHEYAKKSSPAADEKPDVVAEAPLARERSSADVLRPADVDLRQPTRAGK